MPKRLKKGESPRAVQSTRGLSEKQQLPGVESSSMTTLPESQPHYSNTNANVYAFDLLDGKDGNDAEFSRERATREVEASMFEAMRSMNLHPMEAINVALEAAKRFKESWQETADSDLPEDWEVCEAIKEAAGLDLDTDSERLAGHLVRASLRREYRLTMADFADALALSTSQEGTE